MPNVDEINRFLLDRLVQSKLDSVDAVEAAGWLDKAGLLNDSTTRRGKPLRKLLRARRIEGQRQESNNRWFIDRVSNAKGSTDTEDVTEIRPLSFVYSAVESDSTPYLSEVLPDILAEGLRIIFVGTVVGDTSARRQHYYSHQRNVFYRELYRAGLTPKPLAPEEDATLPLYGIGLTDLVKDMHTSNDENLDDISLSTGAEALRLKLRHFSPTWVCFNGKTAYEAFNDRTGYYGDVGETLEGSRVYVVPSTSGRVADTQLLEGKTRSQWFNDLAERVNRQV